MVILDQVDQELQVPQVLGDPIPRLELKRENQWETSALSVEAKLKGKQGVEISKPA